MDQKIRFPDTRSVSSGTINTQGHAQAEDISGGVA